MEVNERPLHIRVMSQIRGHSPDNMSKPLENLIGAVQGSNSLDGNKYGKPEAVAWELPFRRTFSVNKAFLGFGIELELLSSEHFPNPPQANA